VAYSLFFSAVPAVIRFGVMLFLSESLNLHGRCWGYPKNSEYYPNTSDSYQHVQ
jgi:hypothetical protein